MNITDLLNSGELHRRARAARPDCVDAVGNVHISPKRARFVDWHRSEAETHGTRDARKWSAEARAEYDRRYVSSRGA